MGDSCAERDAGKSVPVNKILPYSLVDGPGNRCAVFLQGCNIRCAYCHNPETQALCSHCGLCTEGCPGNALRLKNGRVEWDEKACVGCDRCIAVCPNHSSPKIRWMDADEVFSEINKSVPFIRGVTVSGGECMLYPEFLTELFSLCRKAGLSCLIDTNGTLKFPPGLLECCDGVMLDVKAWAPQVFLDLTGGTNETVIDNLKFLAEQGKLEEIRVVSIRPYVDAEQVIEGIAECLSSGEREAVLLKLIRFRPFGVRGELCNCKPPELKEMEMLRALAEERGFKKIRIV